jgi:ribosome-binding protein aMBF1 (putative translation factor)
MLTPETAQNACCAGLRAGIKRALDVSRLPNSGFVARQIAIHQEFAARQAAKTTVATRLQTALNRLEEIAATEDWSQRKLAAKLGFRESTFRLIKSGHADSNHWLPKLEAAVRRLSTLAVRPSTLSPEVTHG